MMNYKLGILLVTSLQVMQFLPHAWCHHMQYANSLESTSLEPQPRPMSKGLRASADVPIDGRGRCRLL